MLRPSRWTVSTLFYLVLAVFLAESCGPGRAGARRRSPRKLTPLVYKQHFPNLPEKTLSASGTFEVKLTRSHPRFRELVVNYNDDIVFRDEEGNGADLLMTKRCKEKLNTLAISVMNQWPGVKLRVTEAWDDEDAHAVESLHYEGRAVDLTTSDRDRSKYGMLARLAIEAGFDWVYYESRSHIHSSVKRESADGGRTGGCFPGQSLVQTPKGRIKMADLRIGDTVAAVDSEGHLKYSEVVMFLDRDETESRTYHTIETEHGTRITLTPSHLIFATDSDVTDDISRGFVIFARDLLPGDYIYAESENDISDIYSGHKRLRLEKVTNVTASVERGVYAPLTSEGNLLVNDVLASCYAIFNHHRFAHWAFLPVRMAENFKQASYHFLQTLHLQNHKQTPKTFSQKGIHWYAEFLYNTANAILPRRYLYH